MLILCHYHHGSISLVLTTSDFAYGFLAAQSSVLTIEVSIGLDCSWMSSAFFYFLLKIRFYMNMLDSDSCWVILAMSCTKYWSGVLLHFTSPVNRLDIFFFCLLQPWVVDERRFSFCSNGWWFPWPFSLLTWTVFHYISGGSLICFRAYALNVRSEFPFLLYYSICLMIGGLFVCPLREREVVCFTFLLTYAVAVCFCFAYFDITYLGGCLIRFLFYLFIFFLSCILLHSVFTFYELLFVYLFSLDYDTTYRPNAWCSI